MPLVTGNEHEISLNVTLVSAHLVLQISIQCYYISYSLILLERCTKISYLMLLQLPWQPGMGGGSATARDTHVMQACMLLIINHIGCVGIYTRTIKLQYLVMHLCKICCFLQNNSVPHTCTWKNSWTPTYSNP